MFTDLVMILSCDYAFKLNIFIGLERKYVIIAYTVSLYKY